jgi:hypothetical protein
VEAGSNTSTVTLRVIGGDEKRSVEHETVKCRNSDPKKNTLARAGRQGAQQEQDRSCQRLINNWSRAPDVARHQDLLTDRQSQCDFDFDKSRRSRQSQYKKQPIR